MAAQLEAFGIPERKILVVHRGIDSLTFSGSGPRAPRRRQAALISTRNFRPIYRLDVLIQAVAELTRRGHDVEYRLLGRGPLQPTLAAVAEKFGIHDRVEFPGHQHPTAVAEFLRGSDVYLAATLSDGASSSLFEAMACRSFPIVSDIPANAEWISDGVNGLLVKADDPRGIADALERALRDQDLRARAAEHNREIVASKLNRTKNIALMTQRFTQLVEAT
jgi:glycosyltransferase involved in cell wall biosynthesis